ncbi:MAG: hypothetical protein ACFBSE_14935 [Prochloraceae cyanobacterium]
MRIQKDSENLLDLYPCLSVALVQLLNKQEKNWGYFRIKRQDSYYCLSVPYFPHLVFHQNESNLIYKVYWGYSSYKGTWEEAIEAEIGKIIEAIKLKKNALKPLVYTRKKTRNILENNYRGKIAGKKATAHRIVKLETDREKKQRIHEVVINPGLESNFPGGVRKIDRLLAIFIKEKIEQQIADIIVEKNEVKPAVTITEA